MSAWEGGMALEKLEYTTFTGNTLELVKMATNRGRVGVLALPVCKRQVTSALADVMKNPGEVPRRLLSILESSSCVLAVAGACDLLDPLVSGYGGDAAVVRKGDECILVPLSAADAADLLPAATLAVMSLGWLVELLVAERTGAVAAAVAALTGRRDDETELDEDGSVDGGDGEDEEFEFEE